MRHARLHLAHDPTTGPMKVTPTTSLKLSTDFSADWAYTLTADMCYAVRGIVVPDLEAWHGKRLLLSTYKGIVVVHKGYSFDGMTCYPDSAANLSGACLHDALYQTGAVSRKTADDMLRAVLKAQGQPDRHLVHLGVRLFGWLAYKSNPEVTIVRL